MPAEVLVRRVYDASPAADGVRVLVDRIWPRGLRKDAARLDAWEKDVDYSQAAVLAQLLRPLAEPAESALLAVPADGGEAACFAHLVCPGCGAVVTEGHVDGCQLARP